MVLSDGESFRLRQKTKHIYASTTHVRKYENEGLAASIE